MNEQTSNPNAINEGTNEQAAVSSLPVSPEAKPEVVTEVQPEVQKEMDSQAADKRKQVLDEAVSALSLTKSALAALDGKDTAGRSDGKAGADRCTRTHARPGPR